MVKEYCYISHYYMSCLIREINKLAEEGWLLVNVFHEGREYVAVFERNKFVKEEMKI